MREMMDELKEKPKEATQLSNLDLNGLSLKERHRLKKENLKFTTDGMPMGTKVKYLLYYYKEFLIGLFVVTAVAVVLAISIYKGSIPVAVSYAVVNCSDPNEFNYDVMDDYAKHIGKYEGYKIKSDTSIVLRKDEYTKEYEENANSQNYIMFLTTSMANSYDVIITNEEGAEYCAMQGVFYPLEVYLDSTVYRKIKDRIYVAKGMDGAEYECAVDISGTDFAKSLNVGYEDIYIVFFGEEKHSKEVAQSLIDYIIR